jgi:G protein beta subunit-like protein
MLPVVLATGGFDHKIRLWDATSGTCPKIYRFGESQVNCLATSADKGLLLGGGNPLINLFDLKSQSDSPVFSYEGHTNNVTALGFQRDGKWLYSASEDGTLKVWDIRSPTCQYSYDCGAAINTAVLHPNQMEIVTGDQTGCVKVWDLSMNALREEHTPAAESPIQSISIASTGKFMTVGSHKGRVFVYKTEDGKMELKTDFQAHNMYLLKCVISPNTNVLATASADKTVRLWNTETWAQERVLQQHQRWVWDAVFSADSLYLVTASSDQSAKLWDLQTGEVMRNYLGHSLAVTCVTLNDTRS